MSITENVKLNLDFLLERSNWVAIRGLLQNRVKAPAETTFRHRTFHKEGGHFSVLPSCRIIQDFEV